VISKLREQQRAAIFFATMSAVGNFVVSFGLFNIQYFIQFIFMAIETGFMLAVLLSDSQSMRKRKLKESSDPTGTSNKDKDVGPTQVAVAAAGSGETIFSQDNTMSPGIVTKPFSVAVMSTTSELT